MVPTAQALLGCFNCWSVIFLKREQEWRRRKAALSLRQVFAQLPSVHSLVDFLSFQCISDDRQGSWVPWAMGKGAEWEASPQNRGLTVMEMLRACLRWVCGVLGAGCVSGAGFFPPPRIPHRALKAAAELAAATTTCFFTCFFCWNGPAVMRKGARVNGQEVGEGLGLRFACGAVELHPY